MLTYLYGLAHSQASRAMRSSTDWYACSSSAYSSWMASFAFCRAVTRMPASGRPTARMSLSMSFSSSFASAASSFSRFCAA